MDLVNKRNTAVVRRVFIGLILALVLFACLTPVLSYAAGVEDIDIKMTSNGGVEVSSLSGETNFTEGTEDTWTNLYTKIRLIASGIGGVATLVLLIVFIINFAKLGATAGNDQAREKTIKALLFTGIAVACLGSVSIFFGFFYTAL